MSVTVDTNAGEHRLFAELSRLRPGVVRQRLDLGDVLAEHDGKELCFERKTLSDYCSSLVKGHLMEQIARLVGSEGCAHRSVVLCLEASILPNCVQGEPLNYVHTALPSTTFWSSLNTISLKYGIHVMWARTSEEMALQVHLLLERFLSGQLEPTCVAPLAGMPDRPVAKRKRDAADGQQMVHLLQSLPGLGKRAAALAAHYPTLAALCAASHAELAAFQVGTRKLGPKLASTLRAVCHGPPTE